MRIRVPLLAVLLGLASGACAPDPDGPPGAIEPLVFPAEAELGGSAAVAIDSNYLPNSDAFEQHDLDTDRVGIEIMDSTGVRHAATVRGVFPLMASQHSTLAETQPGIWVMVALFDLPTEGAFVYGGSPFTTEVRLQIDGVPVTAATGSIHITGPGGAGLGGQPTQIYAPPVSTLEPQLFTARLRPVRADPPGVGFPEDATIAGMQLDIEYFTYCFTAPRGFPVTDAAAANVYVGPSSVVTGFRSKVRVVVTDPKGFTLAVPAGGDGSLLGEGPLVDLVLGETSQECTGFSPLIWGIRNLYAVAPDGSTVVDERGNDSMAYFAIYEANNDG